MATPMVDDDGNVWEVDDAGKPVRLIAPAAKGRVFSLPPNPKDVRAEARAEEDQQLQRESAVRSERAADRADRTAQRQATAAEKTANAAAKPTEYQAKSAGFLGRMMQAERDFSAVPEGERGGRSLPRQTFHNVAPGLENTLLNSPDRQKADQAIENFIAASLRQESGAAISAGEFERQYKIFYPAPGDSPEVIAQKAAARRQAIEGFRVSAGPLADAIAGIPQQKADNEVPDPTTGANLKPPAADPSPDVPTPAAVSRLDPALSSRVNSLINAGAWETANEVLRKAGHPTITPAERREIQLWQKNNRGQPYTGAKIAAPEAQTGIEQSYLGQGMSGFNEGMAEVLGAPIDLTTALINTGTSGINAIADTEIPSIDYAFLGSENIKDMMGSAIAEPTDDPSKQFTRRVGRSVGSAAVPIGGPGVTAARYGGQLLAGLGGGIGAAAAQQTFPGNPLAEIAGEVAGGGITAGGIAKGLQRNARRQIEAAVPTVPQLKENASELYRAAEGRGVVAGPEQTRQLSENFRAALADEGRISPTGRISEVYPKAREAVQLIDDYAGQTMNPTQIQNVRGVVADALSSPDRSERRLGSILTDVLDEWAIPLAPELGEARDVASRYLTAEQLQRARELAGARASQFSGSGFQNALQTEYRGLDRAAIKGNSFFNDDVTDAIEKVARGTPTSNFFRGLGRLAPTGPVSGMGSVVPAMAVGAMSDPFTGGLVGGTLAGAGIGGRAAATHMGIRAADQAELIARNGGRLPPAFVDPEWLKTLRLYGLAETAKYLPEQPVGEQPR